MADGALPVEVAEPAAHPAAAAREVGRIEKRDRRNVDEDLSAVVVAVAPVAAGDRRGDVAAPGDRERIGGNGERVARDRPLPGEVAAGVPVERGPGEEQHGDRSAEGVAGIAQDPSHRSLGLRHHKRDRGKMGAKLGSGQRRSACHRLQHPHHRVLPVAQVRQHVCQHGPIGIRADHRASRCVRSAGPRIVPDRGVPQSRERAGIR
jgi:hypothetical protein